MAQANEYSFPFDAEEVDGEYDRVYVADEFAQYFRAFITSGIFMEESTSLQTLADSGMNVILSAGQAIIDGYRYELEQDMSFTIEAADGVLDRIDRVSIVWDKANRDIHAEVVKGTASYSPVAPSRRWTEEYRELISADVYVGAGVITIQQKDITDRRLDSTVCGLATPWETIDTTDLYDQIQNELDVFKSKYESDMSAWTATNQNDFLVWYESIQDMLGKDEAGKLLNAINDIKDTVASITQQKITEYNGNTVTETLADGRIKTTEYSGSAVTETFKKADGTTLWVNKTVYSGSTVTQTKEV